MSDKIFMKEITLPIVETGENETYSFVQTDDDLETAGDAADAKKTGDEISALKQDLEGLDVYTLGLYPQMSVADTAVASFTDGADNIPVKSLTVDVTPVQDLHGQDAPYPAGGKGNLFHTTANSKTESGVTWTVNNDGSITVSGTATGFSGITAGRADVLNVTGSVTIQGNVNSTDNVVFAEIYIYDANNTPIATVYSGGAQQTHTVDLTQYSGAAYISVALKRNNNVATSGTYKIQVVKGTTAGEWYPYSNICPISGWNGATIAVRDVNQWDEVWELGAYNSQTGAKETASSSICSSNYNPCIGGATYYNKANTLRFFYYDGNKNYLGTAVVGSDSTFTVPNTARFFTFHVGNFTTYNHDISINYPATDHDYHAYKGNVYSIDWTTEAGTVYGGTLDVTNGVLTVTHAGVVFNGTEDIYYAGSGDGERYFRLYLTNGAKGRTQATDKKCSVYPYYGGSLTDQPNNTITLASVSPAIQVRSDDYIHNVEGFKGYLAGLYAAHTPLVIVYELATPVTYQLTPTEVATILGQNNIFCDTGDIAELTYRADLKAYIDAHVGS